MLRARDPHTRMTRLQRGGGCSRDSVSSTQKVYRTLDDVAQALHELDPGNAFN